MVNKTTSSSRASSNEVSNHRSKTIKLSSAPRTTTACEVCRSRKSRCSGEKPTCKFCLELGIECVYRQRGIHLDIGDKLIIERLSKIESLLHRVAPSPQYAGSDPAESQSTPANEENEANLEKHSTGTNAPEQYLSWLASSSGNGFGIWTRRPMAINTNINIMPQTHTSATMHLLNWPILRDLSTCYHDPQSLLHLEMARESLYFATPTRTSLVNITASKPYVDAYFERVNIWYACVNRHDWTRYYHTAALYSFQRGPESCLVLLVLALGEASLQGSISRIEPQTDPPGLQSFSAAWSLLPNIMTQHTPLAAQCELLAAAYLFYLVRPIEGWSLLQSINTKLQLLLASPRLNSPHQRELLQRIYWNSVLFESDLLTEMNLPHSRIFQLEEDIGLPGGLLDAEGVKGKYDEGGELWYLLAKIALRRLMNRVSQLIYVSDASTSTMGFDTLVAELDHQLIQWYCNLPSTLRFPLTRDVILDPLQADLRLRFLACRSSISRPYVLAVLHNETAMQDQTVQEHCHRCLEAALLQLEHLFEFHAGHMAYLWQGALSIMAQTLLVMGATLSPSLLDILLQLVPHRGELDRIIKDAILEVQIYAGLAPSLSLAAGIISDLDLRRQAALPTSSPATSLSSPFDTKLAFFA